MSEPQLQKVASKGVQYRHFREALRWDVFYEGRPIGQIWRGDNAEGKRTWFLDVPFLDKTLIDGAVCGGYERATKNAVVSELLQWHLNQHRYFELQGAKFHCSNWWDRGDHTQSSYLVLFPNGAVRRINTTEVLEERDHFGSCNRPGWYANAHRGRQQIYSYYCATEEEAITLIMEEVSADPTQAEKWSWQNITPRRFYGSGSLDPKRTYPQSPSMP